MAETNRLGDNDLIPAEIRAELPLGRGGAGGDSEPDQNTQPDIPQEAFEGVDEQAFQSEAEPLLNPSEDLANAPEDSEVIDEFAQSVMLGLEEAGLKEDSPPVPEMMLEEELPPLDGDHDNNQNNEAFFADWGGVEETGQQLPEHGEEAFSREHTLAEMTLATASEGMPAESDLPEDDLTSKHDALADAVQSALMSIYGDSNSQAPHRDDTDARDEASHWNEAAHAQAQEFDDGLSPQDVILNYFSFDPQKADQTDRPEHFRGRDSYDAPSEARPSPRFDTRPAWQQTPEQQPGMRYQPQTPTHESPRYDGPAAFPVPARPAAQVDPKRPGGRESGRLLGAAAIGLVGGIAIAATLAVFVISSYRPLSETSRGSSENKTPLAANSGADPAYGSTSESLGRSIEAANDLVASDVIVTPGQPALLSIKLNSTRPSEQTLISISGVPQGARLNAGIDAGGGNWLLPPRRLNGLTLNLPADAPNTIPLEVQLLDSNVRTPLSEKKSFAVQMSVKDTSRVQARDGERIASASAFTTQTLNTRAATAPSAASPTETPFKARTVIEPAAPAASQSPAAPSVQAAPSAPLPPAAPSSPPPATQIAALPSPTLPLTPPRGAIQQAEIEDLIREGNKRMREGDIIEARQFYSKAVNLGDAEAALAMGRSYDPIYFARLDKRNAEPDVAKALDWYKKAMDSGAAQTAKIRIENLKHFLNE
jgi:hypothetical protein